MNFEDGTLPDENGERKLEEVIKIQKVDASKDFIYGSIIVFSPGLYKIIFDNTYSIWRSKRIEYSVHVLEAKWKTSEKVESLNDFSLP